MTLEQIIECSKSCTCGCPSPITLKFATEVCTNCEKQRHKVLIKFKNYKGIIKSKEYIPRGLLYTFNAWHRIPQWMLFVYDVEKRQERTIAMKDIISFINLPE